jgi:hypothetical protein
MHSRKFGCQRKTSSKTLGINGISNNTNRKFFSGQHQSKALQANIIILHTKIIRNSVQLSSVRWVCIQKPGAVIPHHSADSLTLKKSCDGVVSFSKDLEKFVLDRFYSEGIKERQEAGHGRKTWI